MFPGFLISVMSTLSIFTLILPKCLQLHLRSVIACKEKTDFAVFSLSASLYLVLSFIYLAKLVSNFPTIFPSFPISLVLSLSLVYRWKWKFQQREFPIIVYMLFSWARSFCCAWWKLIWCFAHSLLTQNHQHRVHFFFSFHLYSCRSTENIHQQRTTAPLLTIVIQAARRTQNFYTWIKINCISRQWTLASVTLLTTPIHREVAKAKERVLEKVNTEYIFLPHSLVSRYLFVHPSTQVHVYIYILQLSVKN